MSGARKVTQAAQLAGIVAAIVLAAVINVLGARHFARWDWTADRRWSLAPATVETLRSLEQPVDVWAIAGAGDPFEQSLRQLLLAYRAESARIEVHWIDPDRDAVQLVDLQRRFGLEAGRSEDGRVATDAVVIVASGDQHWFLTPQDLVQQSDDTHVKPREERALTQAIRNVLGGEKAQLCFTVGHGELSLEPERDERENLGTVRSLFEKDNYELRSVDAAAPDAHEPFKGCSVVVIAGAHAPFAPEEANRLRTWLLQGGSLFAAIGPVEGSTDTGMTAPGLDEVLAPFGIALDEDLVHDLDPHPPRTAVLYARSMRHVSPQGAAPASDLLVTSDAAFAKRSIVGASSWADAPPRDPADARGPFVVAMASERPRVGPSASHGPRAVVVGSRFVLAEENWSQPRPLHGAAYFVDSALAWLAARPEVVDVPDRAEVPAGMRISERARAEVERYVLLYMPLAALLLGVAVWAWRRSSENKPYAPGAGGAKGRQEPSP